MSKTLSVAQMLSNLEVRIAFHRERRAHHAAQEAHHREQLASHDAELQKVLERFEAFKAAAAAAEEVTLAPAAEARKPEEPIPYFGSRPMISRLAARVAEDQPPGEPFGARAIAAEVNRRYREALHRPVKPGVVSVALSRLARTGRIRQVRPGKAVYEALYVRDARP